MSSARIEKLLDRITRRAARRPTLVGAVLGHRGPAYFWHRTKLLVPRTLTRSLLGGLELALLAQLIPWELMPPFFLLRGVTWLAGSFHWGLLEGLRVSVRRAYGERRYLDARRIAGAWLLVTSVLALAAFGSAFLWIASGAIDLGEGTGFSVFDAFAVACAFRFSSEALARTYHASLYAIRRVPRSFASLLLPDLVEPLLLVGLFPWLGLWTFGVVTAVAGLTRALVVASATRRGLRRSRLAGGFPRQLGALSRGELRLREGFAAAFAHASTQIDVLLLLALARLGNVELASVLYFARPLLVGAQGALRTFYFDLVALAGRAPLLLVRRFRRFLFDGSVALGVSTGLVLTIGYFVSGGRDARLLSLLPAFCTARSLFGHLQLRAFSDGRYRLLAVLGAPFWVSAAALQFVDVSVELPPSTLLLALTVALFALTFVSDRPRVTSTSARNVVARSDFATSLARSIDPSVVVLARTRARGALRLALVHALAKKFPEARLAWMHRSELALAFDGPRDRSELCLALVEGASGLVDSLSIARFDSGRAALLTMAWPETFLAIVRDAARNPALSSSALRRELEGAPGIAWIREDSKSASASAVRALERALFGGVTNERVSVVAFPNDDDPEALVLLGLDGDRTRAAEVGRRLECESIARALADSPRREQASTTRAQ